MRPTLIRPANNANAERAGVIRLPASRLGYLLPLFGCIAIAVGAVLYCCTSYDALVLWYLHLYSCIYNAATWQQKFFTPATKSAGNTYAVGGIFVAIAAAAYFIRKLRHSPDRLYIEVAFSRKDGLALALLYATGAIIWTYGAITAYPSYDEVFSVMNCARIHPLQTASYYMLPNNHVFFNLLNALPAHVFSNGVVSGRIISCLACAPLVALVYFYLRSLTGSRYVATIIVAVLMLQFVVWAFSVQARGYALYLAASWAAFIFLDYYLRRGNALSLALHGLCVVIGCWTVPSFLLWEAALIAYAALRMIKQRSMNWPIAYTHLVAAALVYLVHLPILLFSGKAALTENGYVRRSNSHWSGFARDSWYELRHLFRYAFAELPSARYECDLLLAVLPVIVYPFVRCKPAGRLLLFYILMWGAFCAMELRLRHFPPLRNLIAQQSVSLAAILLAAWAATGSLPAKSERIRRAIMSAICAALAIVFARYNYTHIQEAMYGYNMETSFKNVSRLVSHLPPGTRLATSPESFYPRYVCSLRGIPASDCMDGRATTFIRRADEPMPAAWCGRADKVDSAEDYEVFRLR